MRHILSLFLAPTLMVTGFLLPRLPQVWKRKEERSRTIFFWLLLFARELTMNIYISHIICFEMVVGGGLLFKSMSLVGFGSHFCNIFPFPSTIPLAVLLRLCAWSSHLPRREKEKWHPSTPLKRPWALKERRTTVKSEPTLPGQ